MIELSWYDFVIAFMIIGICVDLILVGYVIKKFLNRIEKLENMW